MRCCICKNESKKIRNLKLYSFPRDREFFEKWRESTGLNISYEKRLSYRVCSQHFDPECFFPANRNRTNLKANAIPTLLLNVSDSSHTRHPPPAKSDEKNSESASWDDLNCDSNNHTSNKDSDFCHPSSIDGNFAHTGTQHGNNHLLVTKQQPNAIIASTFNSNSIKTEKIEIKKPYFKALRSLSVGSNAVYEVCRLCFRLLSEEETIKLYDETTVQDKNDLKNMLHQVLPDLDLIVYPNIVICTKCSELLRYSYELRKTWTSTEEQIKKIAEAKKSVTNSESDLIIVTRSKVGEVLTDCHQEETLKKINTDHSYEKTHCNVGTLTDPRILKRNYYLMRQESLAWGKGPYLCEKCGCVTKSRCSMRKHLQKHKDNKWSESYPIKGRIKNVPKTLKCITCQRLFTTEKRLQIHIERHQRRHKCIVCDKEFTTKVGLNSHINIIHLGTTNRYQCHLCGKQFTYRTSLNLHFKTHNLSQSINCDICNKKYKTRFMLLRHLRKVHNGNLLLSCEYCGKSLKYRQTLEAHIRAFHLKQGNTVCNICDKPFFKKSSLMIHKIRVHGCC